jgi:hypothetical protein
MSLVSLNPWRSGQFLSPSISLATFGAWLSRISPSSVVDMVPPLTLSLGLKPQGGYAIVANRGANGVWSVTSDFSPPFSMTGSARAVSSSLRGWFASLSSVPVRPGSPVWRSPSSHKRYF